MALQLLSSSLPLVLRYDLNFTYHYLENDMSKLNTKWMQLNFTCKSVIKRIIDMLNPFPIPVYIQSHIIYFCENHTATDYPGPWFMTPSPQLGILSFGGKFLFRSTVNISQWEYWWALYCDHSAFYIMPCIVEMTFRLEFAKRTQKVMTEVHFDGGCCFLSF